MYFPREKNALKIQSQNNKISQEIEMTRLNFKELEREFGVLNKYHCDLQSHCIESVDSYIKALEIAIDGEKAPKMPDSIFIKELRESRERLSQQLAQSEKLLHNEKVLEPQFELMPPSSTPDKSTSQPSPTE
jgi:hypothetical protein